jgi:predicted ferric reductase
LNLIPSGIYVIYYSFYVIQIKTIKPTLYGVIQTTKTINMNNLFYLIVVFLVVLWALGFFVYNTGSIIHILLVIAVIAILLRIINGNNRIK